MCRKAGIADENILKWDLQETAPGGPFNEVEFILNPQRKQAKEGGKALDKARGLDANRYRQVAESDIFINCIYL